MQFILGLATRYRPGYDMNFYLNLLCTKDIWDC